MPVHFDQRIFQFQLMSNANTIKLYFICLCVFSSFFSCWDGIKELLLLKTKNSVIDFFFQRLLAFDVLLRLPQYWFSQWLQLIWINHLLVGGPSGGGKLFVACKTRKKLNLLRVIHVLELVFNCCSDIKEGNEINFSFPSLCFWF